MSGSSGSDWARQDILDRIARATERSATSLEDMASRVGGNFTRLTQGAQQAGQATQELAEDTKKGKKGIKESLADLRKSLQETSWDRRRRGQQFREWGSSLADGSQSLRNATQYISNSLSSLPIAGPILGGVIGAATGLIGSLINVRETFINLVDTGIMFEGSLSQFRIAMGNAGLTAEQFAGIVNQYGQTVQLVGERNFLSSTLRLAQTFDNFGISLVQGNEWFAEYLDNSRLSGMLYLRTQQQQREGFEINLGQMREQARMNGISLRQQREQQRQLRENLEYQVLLRSVSPERREYMESQVTAITPIAGADFAREFMTFVETGASRRGGFMAAAQTLGVGGELFELAARARAGEALDAENLQRAIVNIPAHTFRTLLNMIIGGSPELAERLMAMRRPAEARILRTTEVPPGNLTPETIQLTAAQNNLSRALGQANATAVSLGATLLDLVLPYLDRFNNLLRNITTAAPGEGLIELARGMGAGEGMINIMRVFRDQGVMAGLGTIVTGAVSGASTLFRDTLGGIVNSLLEGLTNWSNRLIADLRSLIPSWLQPRTEQDLLPLNVRLGMNIVDYTRSMIARAPDRIPTPIGRSIDQESSWRPAASSTFQNDDIIQMRQSITVLQERQAQLARERFARPGANQEFLDLNQAIRDQTELLQRILTSSDQVSRNIRENTRVTRENY